MTQSKFVGVDGCPFGWFSVGISFDSDFEVKVFRTFAELLTHYQAARLILIDIPIGLPENEQRRQCDGEARGLLGSPRSSSVFTAPTRQTVRLVGGGGSYNAANANESEITGRGITKQSYAICRKIDEVDRALLNWQAATPNIKEVHPEICFWAFVGRNPMVHRKKTTAGIEERKNVLRKLYPKTQEIYDQTCSEYRRNQVARDDILDALAAAVTSYRGHNDLQGLPEADTLPRDAKGLPMEMVYWIPQAQP